MSDPDPVLIRQALSELRDANKEKRRTAVMKLGMAGGDQAILTLISLVRSGSEDLIVRGRAAMMLGKMGDARAVDPLIEALDAPGYQTRVNAAESLGKLGDARAVEPLLHLVRTEAEPFRGVAQAALKALGYNEQAFPANASDFITQPTLSTGDVPEVTMIEVVPENAPTQPPANSRRATPGLTGSGATEPMPM